ncbi:MAG TPA: preprotein translocase subunit SecE [Firmicutes bacterium]|nr:preprotein translocase subunit SecE [Bacillota bacterium]
MSLMARLAGSGRGMLKFFKEVRMELKRVVWPNRHQTLVYTAVVLAAVAFVTVLLYVVDTAVGYLFRWLLGV